jgi:hypothetical protein
MLQTPDGKGMLNYAITLTDGRYEFFYSGTRDSLMLVVTGFNIKQQSKSIGAGESRTVDFFVTNEMIMIEDVMAKAPEIVRRGDTLTYVVASFSDTSDRSIGEVLKKMPGIEVEKTGRISYQGRPINKFYIEDMDMLQGRYGIATNNILAKDIASVQVYENHQPIRALQDVVASDNAALNLKLKESAKGTFNAVVQAGVGYKPWMWNGEVVPMYFSGKFQALGSYKTNNTGEDAGTELNPHYTSSEFASAPLSVTMPLPPPFDKQRYLDNNIHTVSANSITKIAERTTLTVNASLLHDRQGAAGETRTTYFFPDTSPLAITEIIRNKERNEQLNAGVLVEANKDNLFLREKFSFSGRRDNDRSRVTNDEGDVTQTLGDENATLSNDFHLVKTVNFNRVSFSSVTSWSRQPSSLVVTPLFYEDLFDGGTFTGMRQDITSGRLRSVNDFYAGRTIGKFFASLDLGADVNTHKMESWLRPIISGDGGGVENNFDASMRNDLTFSRVDFRLGPSLNYNGSRFTASLYTPVNYMRLKISDRADDTNSRAKNTVTVIPAASFRWTLHHNLKMSGSASFYTGYGGETDNHSGYIMTDYRTVGSSKGDIRESRTRNYSLSLNYGNALRSLFGSLDAGYWHTKSNLMYGTLFSGIFSMIESYPIDNISRGNMVGARIGKRFREIATTFNISGQYIFSFSDVLRQDEVMGTRNDMINAGVNTITRFGNTARLDYDVSWMRSLTSLSRGGTTYTPIDVVQQAVEITLFLSERVNLNISGEHYFNSATGGRGRNAIFADARLTCNTKRVEYIVETRNLFGTTHYNAANYGEAISSMYSYDLRPRSIMFKIRLSIK